jgi:hypothetical protein
MGVFPLMKYRVTFACRLDVESPGPDQAIDRVRELVPDYLHPLSFFKPLAMPVWQVTGIRRRPERRPLLASTTA